jgi:putative flippase GtrA
MFAWAVEKTVIARYLLSGVANTLFGFGLIFGLMLLEVSAYIANLGGYIGGLLLGFFVSRKFVFDIKGTISRQFFRYILSFAACVATNLFVLTLAIEYFNINQVFSQFLAAASYTTAMFLMSRFYVFKNTKHASAA